MADRREDDYISSLSGSQMDAALLDMAERTSEAWAVGERNGIDVSNIDPTYHNNAKYYAEQAARVVPTQGVPAIRYDVEQVLSDAEHEIATRNVYGKVSTDTDEFISKVSEHNYLAKIKKLTGKSVVQNNAIVDAAIKGFGSTGKNLFDKGNVVVGAAIYYSSGNIGANAALSYAYIPILPNTTYTISGQQNFSSGYGNVWLDKDKQYISGVNVRNSTSNVTATSPSNARYMGVTVGNADQTFHDIDTFQVELGATATEYAEFVVPYFRNFPIVLRSAGNVADTVEDTGNGYKVTHRVGRVDLGSLSWAYDSTYAHFYETSIKPKADGDSIKPNLTCGKYSTVSYVNRADKTVYVGYPSLRLYIKDTSYTDATAFKNSLNGVYLNYELATPTVEYHSYNLTYPVTENGTEYFDSPISVPCEIEYGIDAIKDIAKGVVGGDTERDNKPVLLWENASPNSQFVAQTVSLDLSTYKYVMVMFHEHPSDAYPCKTGIYPIGNKYSVTSFTGASTAVTGAPYFIKRMFTVQNNGITFEGSYYATPTVQMAANNAEFIPVRIYGIK